MQCQFIALLIFALSLTATAADKREEADDSWIQAYYQHPQPERFETEVKKLASSGALRKESAMPPVAAFFSRLFQGAKPAQLSQWLKYIEELPEADQRVFAIALRWAGTNETQDALRAIAARGGEAATDARKLLDTEAPVLEKITDPSPGELDMCWGAFFATGDSVYALPVIRCAVKPMDSRGIDMSQQAARWSLKSLCATHKKLREIKDTFYETASPAERKALEEMFKE